jgi:tetratricopeptide (TPR) repeat protein
MMLKKIQFITGIMLFILVLPLYSQSSPGTSSNAIDLYNIGRDLESREQLAEADNYYNMVVNICNDEISRNTANRNTYTALTWALLRQRKYREVTVFGEQGLRVYADEYRIMETLGEAYFHLYDYNNSLRYMQRYVNSLPNGERISIAYFYVGEIYRIQEKYYLADMAYSTAVRYQPGIALWWYRLGSAREITGYPQPAAEAYERALALSPDYQAARDGLTRVRNR